MEAPNPKKYHIKWLADSAGNITGSASYNHLNATDINTVHASMCNFITDYPKAKGEVEECHCAGR